MDRTVVGVNFLSNIGGISGLSVERRSPTEYDDIREESSSYSHTFAEDDPEDKGPGLVNYALKEAENG